jgi:hypothetical protein
MIYLNGKLVDTNKVDPTKHKFIGMFRLPNPPDTTYIDKETKTIKYADCYGCPCGHFLWSQESIREHWKNGHMDIAQYVDI